MKLSVIPAKAGIQTGPILKRGGSLDSRFRGNDKGLASPLRISRPHRLPISR